jgi:hypothetical protein
MVFDDGIGERDLRLMGTAFGELGVACLVEGKKPPLAGGGFCRLAELTRGWGFRVWPAPALLRAVLGLALAE